jgi:hypothetical protein
MKSRLLVLLTFLSFSGFAQVSKIEGVNSFSLTSAGAILDKNKDVDGYYFYYVVDKLKKGEREFAIEILDKNLNEVARKTYVDNKNTFLMNSSFNNQSLMFAMANFKEKKIDLLTFDKQANQQKTISIPLETKEIQYLRLTQQTSADFNLLFPVENKGFIFNKFEDNKKIGYSLRYYPTDGGKGWVFNSPEKSKEIVSINPIEVNDKIVVAIETARPGMLSRKMTIRTKIIDVETGKLIFEVENSKKDNPRLINNAFIDKDNNIILMGEYFKEGDNIFDDRSLGIFTQVFDIKGNSIKEVLTSWADDVSKIAKTSKSFIDDKGYVFFHKIVKTDVGDYFAIGEYYKRTASAVGIGMALLTRGQAPVTQITITDAVIFKFNSDFKLVAIKDFDKSTSRAPSVSDFGSPQLNAHTLKSFGAFDYEYTQLDKVNDRFYACFIDYEKAKGTKSRNAFKTIIYDDGELSEDKIFLKDGDKVFRVFPAKVGNVMLLEYNKKAKTLEVHLEKINIK